MKTGKLLVAGGALAAMLTMTLSGAVLANGVGDLYVASAAGVLEIHVKTSTVVSTIPMVPAPMSLAFTPDGSTLYAAGGGSAIIPIDIATLDVQSSIIMPGPVSVLAFPAGQILVGSMPTRRTLAFAVIHGGAITESAELPGAGNLLAADRREARLAVAEAGKNWLEVVDPATSTMKKTTVDGNIVALAIDRTHDAVLVATQTPNALICVDLTSLVATWTVTLDGSPVAVAALSRTVIVAGGTNLWNVDGKTAVKLATTRQAAVAVAASDEGSVVHVAEAGGIEVFDSKGILQRTLELTGDRAPTEMAAVPRGSSLFIGQGVAEPSASTTTAAVQPGSLKTPEPPPTDTVMDTATKLVSSPPLQGAAAVATGILFLCWVFIGWYDKRQLRS